MTRIRAALRLTAIATLATAGLAACGDSESASDSESPAATAISTPSSEQQQAIVSVLNAQAASTTPEQYCATITRGLEASIAALGAPPTLPPEEVHKPASANCPAVITKAVKDGQLNLKAATVSVGKVLVQRDLAGALVNEGQQERPYFLVNSSGTWLVNVFGTAPPDFQELLAALRG